MADTHRPNSLDAFWMPFTPNKAFKADPRLVVRAEGMHYYTSDGRAVLDGTSGLWCVAAGHAQPRIVQAIQRAAAELDYAGSFNLGHPTAFEFANRLTSLLPANLDRIFFTNSGSESVDTALKIALAYQKARGKPGKYRLIGRERAYHGVNFGGISVGGIGRNRIGFGPMVGGVDHLPHTHDIARNAFSKGQPKHGQEYADALERIILTHDASTIAAIIVEPVAGSTGVLVPPQGYLQRLRELCTKHDILLIFDEVITGFGRVGNAFAAQRFGVVPDMITTAKGLTNGSIPMGAVFASNAIHDAFMHGPEGAIELFHGYTYSGHPVACAAALATLDIYAEEKLFDKAIELGPYWEDALHALKDLPNVIDIRNFGLIGAVELASRPGAIGARAYEVFTRCFHDKDLLIRTTGDVIALSPPLIIQRPHIDSLFQRLAEAIRETA